MARAVPGEFRYLGFYDDPVLAAKARDRTAYERHGEHAYLNFPEDYPCPRNHQRREGAHRRKKAKAR